MTRKPKKQNRFSEKKPMGLRRRILLITILMMAVLFTIGFGFLSSLLNRSILSNAKDNSVHMKDVRALLEKHMGDIALLQNALRWDDNLMSYYSLHERGNTVSKAEAQKELHKKMELLLSANKTASKMMMVFPELKTVISGEGSFSYPVFLDAYTLNEECFNEEKISSLSAKIIPATHVTVGITDVYDASKDIQLHIAQLTSHCYAVVGVPQIRIDSMLNTQFRGKDMDIYVLTTDDNIYASSCSSDGEPLTVQEVLTLWNERSEAMTLNGSHYDVMYTDMGSLRVVTLFQRSLREEALYSWRIMLGVVCVGFIVLSVVLFLLMDRWFYSPMKNLLVSYGMVPEKNSEQNEYMQISRAMEQMSENIAFLEQRMRDEEQRALEQTPGLFLDSESPARRTQYYAVFTLVFENGKGVYQHDRCRRLCMMIEKEFPLAVIYDHNAIFACVIGLNEKRTPDAMLAGMLEALQESGDYVRIGISDVHEASEELSVAYEECHKALNSRTPGLVVGYVPDGGDEKDNHFKVKLAHQVDLARFLTGRDFVQAKNKLDEIYDANSDLNLYWQCRLSRYLLDLLLVMSGSHSTAWMLAMDAREELASSHNAGLLRERVYTCYEQMCTALQHGDDDLSERLKSYIEDHLGDSDLTLNKAADAVGRSYSYVSTFFSKTVGVSFSEYLQKRRIVVAMRLLAETNEPVAKIAAQVGYEVPSSFIRLFKKETSMTPGQYREATSRMEGGEK
ncbi:MAG: helix-turn-helix domain-containing protein [Clostridia bacterium]|nr:helix-turn-helix domain-containing protein [Clostridia bacterium]